MSSEKELPELFVIDSKGKKRSWKCWVVGDTVYRLYGLVDGKKIESKRTFIGKSIGKKNETTPEEQAWSEANKEWVKHVDKKYEPSKNDKKGQKLLEKIKTSKNTTGGHNINAGAAAGAQKTKLITRKMESTFMVDKIDGDCVIPMKAQVWEIDPDDGSVLPKVSKYFSKTTGKGKNMKIEPTKFYGQPKLDGWRARVMLQTSKGFEICITSNSGKQYPWFESLRKTMIDWLKNVDYEDLLDGLDGELFVLQLYNNDESYVPQSALFSTICSICGLSRSQPHELEDQIQFHVFDLVDKSGKYTQVERFERLDRLWEHMPEETEKRVVRVPTEIIENVEDVPEFHDKFASMGYEGIVVRTFQNFYKAGKRSTEMRKFKHFIDEEYEITGCKLDKGVPIEHFVWLLKSEEHDKTFSAKPMGTREEKLEWYKNRKKYIGRFLTVKFQEYTEDGIPRFPIAKEFRQLKGID